MTLQSVRKAAVLAAIVCIAVICLAPFCQATPLDSQYYGYFDSWSDGFAREEVEGVVEDVMDRISSELEEMASQQQLTGVCYSGKNVLGVKNSEGETSTSTIDFEDGAIVSTVLNFFCINESYALFVKKNGNYQSVSSDKLVYKCKINPQTGVQEGWDNSIKQNGFPHCFLKCPKQTLRNGKVEPDTAIEPGETVTYSCNKDKEYRLKGPEKRTCGRGQDGGFLEKEEPKCVPLCPKLPTIQNGRPVTYDLLDREPGSVATYSCIKEYRLEGSKTRTCGPNGEWSGEEPKCILSRPPCPDPSTVFDFTNADPSNTRPIYNRFTPGTIDGSEFTYKCQQGYVLFVSRNGGNNFERSRSDEIRYQCLFDFGSTYNRSIEINGWPKCFPLCPDLPNIPNGQVKYIRREPGYIATYSCDEDSELSGSKTRRCQLSGIWSGIEPQCVQTKCRKLRERNTPKNALSKSEMNKLQKNPNWRFISALNFYERKLTKGDRSVGSQYTMRCINGWKLQRGTPTVQTCVRRADGTLDWTPAGKCGYGFTYVDIVG